MRPYQKITIILRDSDKHNEYNRRVLDYLHDRHPILNDNMYTIAINVVDDNNINEFVRQGVQSIPAMKVADDEDFVYGVNSILSSLAKLEMTPVSTNPNAVSFREQKILAEERSGNAYYDMVMEEMSKEEQEDPDASSTIKTRHQDLPETPLNEKMIEEKAKAYNRIYDKRKNQGPIAKPASQKPINKSAGINVDKYIQEGKFDKGEEMFMRQIAQNLT